MATGIGEFFVSLVIDGGQGAVTVSDLAGAIGSLEASTIAEIGALWQLGVGLARITDEAIKGALGLELLTAQTGESGQVLQKWQNIAAQAHVPAEDMARSIVTIDKAVRSVAMGIPNDTVGALAKWLGIGALNDGGGLKNAGEILTEIRHKFAGIKDDATKSNLLDIFHIPQSMLLFFKLTDDQVAAYSKTAKGMSAEQEKSFLDLQTKMVQFQLVLKDFSLFMAGLAAPTLKKDLQIALDLIKKIKDEVRTGSGFFGGISTFVTLLGKDIGTAAGKAKLFWDDAQEGKNQNKLTMWEDFTTNTPLGRLFKESPTPASLVAGDFGSRHISVENNHYIRANDPRGVAEEIDRRHEDQQAFLARMFGNGGY